MGTLSVFKRDENLEKGGVDIEINGMVFTCRRAGGSNNKYIACVQREYRKRKHAIDANLLSPEEDCTMMAVVYADAVIIGWKNVTDNQDSEVEFNRSNCIKVLSSYPELFDILKAACSSREHFKIAEMEVDSGN